MFKEYVFNTKSEMKSAALKINPLFTESIVRESDNIYVFYKKIPNKHKWSVIQKNFYQAVNSINIKISYDRFGSETISTLTELATAYRKLRQRYLEKEINRELFIQESKNANIMLQDSEVELLKNDKFWNILKDYLKDEILYAGKFNSMIINAKQKYNEYYCQLGQLKRKNRIENYLRTV